MPLDHTQLECFQTCPTRYRYRYVEQIKRAQELESDIAPRFGQALHAGLASIYQKKPELYAAQFKSVFPQALSDKEMVYTPANGVQILTQYRSDVYVRDQDWTVLAVETPLTFELSPGIEYLVKLDTVIENESGIWSLEHKSTQSKIAFTDMWWAQFEPNNQLSGQVWAIKQKWGSCEGVIVNGIGFSYGPRKGFDIQFQRQSFTRTPDQLLDWQGNVLAVIDRLEQTRRSDRWEKHESQCVRCQYKELCIGCGNDGIKDAMYVLHDSVAYQQEG